MTAFQAPVGTRDILFPESARVEEIVAKFATITRRAGYGLLISPMFEDSSLFRRGAGETTELVTKEMYEFKDRSGRSLALRPEGTASIVRAFVQHRPNLPWKTWYVTPAFRYERPQAGRYRQHHQLGIEALGSEDPGLDVEVVAILHDFLVKVGVTDLDLRVNSMGDGVCRPGYTALLLAFLKEHVEELCAEHTTSYEKNPLRVLDCKRAPCQALRPFMPRIVDHLCDPCRVHHGVFKEGLALLAIPFIDDDFLVRGFDYYTRTTFEFQALSLDTAQNALGGGGRYDGLVEELGGPPTPGIGFGAGIERILLALERDEKVPVQRDSVEVFVVDLTDGLAAIALTGELRRAGIATDRAFDGRSAKAQLRQADRSGARIALIVGEKELDEQCVTVRLLKSTDERRQWRVKRDEIVQSVRETRT